jgi:hypothetical protein
MGKVVGLSRVIKPKWLDKTVEFFIHSEDEASTKEMLNDYLSFEIQSSTNLRKTREILLNIWVRPKESEPIIHELAVNAYRSEKSDKMALNWAMILLAYPIFSDVTFRIGKIGMIQDTFTTSWLRDKLTEAWGDRTTLFHSCDKILQTLKALGAIENQKQGVYKIKKHVVKDEKSISVLLMCLLTLKRQAYYELSEISNHLLLFPFEYKVTLELLRNIPEINISNFGGKMVVAIKE